MNSQDQQQKTKVFIRKAARQERIISFYIFFLSVGICVFLFLGANNQISMERIFGPCGFKMKYNLPCPACGMTTSMLAFFKGQIIQSAKIQPTGSILCIILLISAVLTFISAFLGVYFSFIDKIFTKIKLRYIIILTIAVFLLGWLMSLVNAISLKN